MKPPLSIGFPNFVKHEGKIFTLLFYLDIDNQPGQRGYKFRTLFKSNSGMYLIEKIPVEIAINYPVNVDYQVRQSGMLQIKKNKNISAKQVLFIPENQKIEKLKNIIQHVEHFEYKFESTKGKKDFTSEILNQFFVICDDILIPCTLIASKFYFTSSRIVPHILYNTLKNTHDGIEKINDRYEIKLKHGYSDVDSAKIIFFTFDDYAKKSLIRLSSYYQKLKQSRSIHFPLLASFPFWGIFEVEIDFMQVEKYRLVNHLRIQNDLPWKSYKVAIVKIKKFSPETDEIEHIKEQVIPQIIPEDTTGTLSQNFPKKYLKTAGIRITEEKEDFTNLIDKKILKERGKIRFKNIYRKDNQETDELSQQLQVNDIDNQKQIIPVVFLRDKNTEKIDNFTLQDFLNLINLLKNLHKINTKVEMMDIPEIKKDKKSVNQFEYYDKQGKFRRKCVIVYFLYKNKHVLLFEIDQSGFKIGTSTFVFVSTSKYIMQNKWFLIKTFFARYIEGIDKETIEKKILEKFRVNLIYKKHPSKKGRNLGISWCNSLLRRIESL